MDVVAEEGADQAEPALVPDAIPKSLSLDGYALTATKRARSERTGIWTGYYVCAHHRKGCKAKLNVSVDVNNEVTFVRKGDAHSCGVQQGQVNDLRDLILDTVGARAIQEPHKQAKTIAREVLDEYEAEYVGQPCKMPNLAQLERKVYNSRNQVSATWETLIRSYPLNSINPDDNVRFLKFNACLEEDGEYINIVGWAHPELLFLFRHGSVNLYIDCTFKCVPHPFTQCMIVMVYSSAYRTYVPVFHVLLQSKTQFCYWAALHHVIIAAEWEVSIKTVTADFELALVNAIYELL